MNLSKPLRSVSRSLHTLFLRFRSLLPKQKCLAFTGEPGFDNAGIGPVYVINLDRQPGRWRDMVRELSCISDCDGNQLSNRTVRYSACDAQAEPPDFLKSADVDNFYTLKEQLFVEPQPLAMPADFDLERPIGMTKAEIAIAHSHIGVWRAIAGSSAPFALVLEDDVWIDRAFGRVLDQAWRELADAEQVFDILYVSYEEVRHGAPKELLSRNVFRPERGLWFLSGYVLSRKGARALIDLLPCRGPVDLWINHRFPELTVRALRRSVINQRRDLLSTNSYSILPTLSRIGVIDSGEAALFHRKPTSFPVFAFGPAGSGLSSLAMALSMLGYRCCSDFDAIPDREFTSLLGGSSERVFDAYVNIGSLTAHAKALARRYPSAKFIATGPLSELDDRLREALDGTDVLFFKCEEGHWRPLCEHLRLPPPDALFPKVVDAGLRTHQAQADGEEIAPAKSLRHDPSPWVAEMHPGWKGISAKPWEASEQRLNFFEDFAEGLSARWICRDDTFPGNQGLFRPANVTTIAHEGLSLVVAEEPLGVRDFSAGAISSRRSFLFGRFEATLKASNVPGIVTGFFLHRDSPRQEIDVEIRGNQPHQLLVNVFYNPGSDGAKFDYGYRGTPAMIELGFDASEAFHRFAIEWDPLEIRWFVDDKLVHRRPTWAPTPIPQLPMILHVNAWPSRSKELAGRLALDQLPASARVRLVSVETY